MDKNQEKILNNIRGAKVKEELAIPIYTEHLREVLFWSGIPDEKRDAIIKNLKTLEIESEGHVEMLKRVEEIYLKSLE